MRIELNPKQWLTGTNKFRESMKPHSFCKNEAVPLKQAQFFRSMVKLKTALA